MITCSSKAFTGLLVAATLALSTAALTSPAEAHWHGGWGPGFGVGLGIGLGLGLAAPAVTYNAPVACRIVNTYDRFGNYLGKMRRCG